MFQIDKVPFSRFGSFSSLSVIDWGPLGRGLYLQIHAGKTLMAFRIDPVRDGKVLEYKVETSPSLLKLKPSGGGEVEFVISGLETPMRSEVKTESSRPAKRQAKKLLASQDSPGSRGRH